MKKFLISRDDQYYHAWPDITLTSTGKLLCVFSECTRHAPPRPYTRIMLVESTDNGRTWSAKRAITDPTNEHEPYWNCPRIVTLKDGRIAVCVDKLLKEDGIIKEEDISNYLLFSNDDGASWTEPQLLPCKGIVPDKLVELNNGRWLYSCHIHDQHTQKLYQRLWYSEDKGESWSGPVLVAKDNELNFCEITIMQISENVIAGLLRENSFQGYDAYKVLSYDNGLSWSEPTRFPLPGCHRPVMGKLDDERVLVTYRFLQGGKGWLGAWTQNLFAALTTVESLLSERREDATARILPVDFDRSDQSDIGYSGWVHLPDGEIYIVNYLVDDAPKAQIRGYALNISDFILPPYHNQ